MGSCSCGGQVYPSFKVPSQRAKKPGVTSFKHKRSAVLSDLDAGPEWHSLAFRLREKKDASNFLIFMSIGFVGLGSLLAPCHNRLVAYGFRLVCPGLDIVSCLDEPFVAACPAQGATIIGPSWGDHPRAKCAVKALYSTPF